MKKKLVNSLLLSSLLCLIALSNCSTNDNHANTPPGAPASEYPGNRSDSTTHTDSIHH